MDIDKLNRIELQLKAINTKMTFFVVIVVLWILGMVAIMLYANYEQKVIAADKALRDAYDIGYESSSDKVLEGMKEALREAGLDEGLE